MSSATIADSVYLLSYDLGFTFNPSWFLGARQLLYHESNHQTSQWFLFSPILCSNCHSQYNMTKVEDTRMHLIHSRQSMLKLCWTLFNSPVWRFADNNVWKMITVLHQVCFQQSFLQMLSKSLVSLLLDAIPLFVTNFRYRHRFLCRGQSMKQFYPGYFKT